MRISKDLAYQVAEKMTEGSRKKVEEHRNALQVAAKEIYQSKIPAKVMDLFKTHCEYFETCSAMWVDEKGFNRETIHFEGQLPTKNGSYPRTSLTDKEADRLIKLKREWEKAQAAYDLLKKETKQALLTLGTFARIRENLPEAAPFLPPPMSNALVVNFDDLKKKLAKQPETPENAKLKKQYAAVIVKTT